MQPIEKLKNRLSDAIDQIELSLENKFEKTENEASTESIISENLNLKRQVDNLKDQLENSNKDDEAKLKFENLSAELNNLRAEREEEKRELQSLYDQLSSALAASEETV